MKLSKTTVAMSAVTVLAILAWVSLPSQNSIQIAGFLHDTVAHAPTTYTNAADTSSTFSMSGYIGAAWFISTGDTAATGDVGGYFVYQDSSNQASWTTRDSIELAGVNGSYKLHYIPRGAGAKVRSIYRGTAASGDTLSMSAVLLRSCQRAPC